MQLTEANCSWNGRMHFEVTGNLDIFLIWSCTPHRVWWHPFSRLWSLQMDISRKTMSVFYEDMDTLWDVLLKARWHVFWTWNDEIHRGDLKVLIGAFMMAPCRGWFPKKRGITRQGFFSENLRTWYFFVFRLRKQLVESIISTSDDLG